MLYLISGDDSDTYQLIYKNDLGDTWKVNVSSSRSYKARIGEIAYAVYLDGRKKPLLHYDMDGKQGGIF